MDDPWMQAGGGAGTEGATKRDPSPPKAWRWARRLLWVLMVGVLLMAAVAIWVGDKLAAPAPRQIGDPDPRLGAEAVSFESTGSRIHGWFLPAAAPEKAVVVLAHGIGGDRRSMLGRAEFLRKAGYASLVFDLRAHGESTGDARTFGFLESHDVRAAVRFGRRRCPDCKVVVIGRSMGGAACLIGDPVLDADVLVLESVYATLHEAVANRMHHAAGFLGWCATPLLTWQSWFLMGVTVDACRPIDGLPRFRGPVLLIAGAEDPHTPPAESQRMFEAAKGPKDLWFVPGAAHVDYWRVAREQYESRVLRFLARHLGAR